MYNRESQIQLNNLYSWHFTHQFKFKSFSCAIQLWKLDGTKKFIDFSAYWVFAYCATHSFKFLRPLHTHLSFMSLDFVCSNSRRKHAWVHLHILLFIHCFEICRMCLSVFGMPGKKMSNFTLSILFIATIHSTVIHLISVIFAAFFL